MDNNAATQIDSSPDGFRAVSLSERAAGGDSYAVAAAQPVSESAALILMIERAARDPAVDIQKLERMMGMYERVEAKNAESAFNNAVARAKAEIPPIVKNRVVDFTSQKGRTSYRHEDMAEVARTVDPVLTRHGLAYRYRSTQEQGRVTVTCILSHMAGHREETTLSAAEDHSGNKNTIQAIGSATTYLQRYTLKLALGISSSADDDGRSASGAGTSNPIAAPVTGDEIIAFRSALKSKGVAEGEVCSLFSVETIEDMTRKQFSEATARLAKTRARK